VAGQLAPIDGTFVFEEKLARLGRDVAKKIDVATVDHQIEFSVTIPVDETEGAPSALAADTVIHAQRPVAAALRFVLRVVDRGFPSLKNALARQQHALAIAHNLAVEGEVALLINRTRVINSVAIEIDHIRRTAPLRDQFAEAGFHQFHAGFGVAPSQATFNRLCGRQLRIGLRANIFVPDDFAPTRVGQDVGQSVHQSPMPILV